MGSRRARRISSFTTLYAYEAHAAQFEVDTAGRSCPPRNARWRGEELTTLLA